MTYQLDPAAQQDLEAYITHVAKDDVAAALRQDERIAEGLTLLGDNPRMGRRTRIEGSVHSVRSFAIAHTPLIAFYIVDTNVIRVLRLFHSAREPITR